MRFFFISTMHDSRWGGCEELWSQAATRLRRAGNDVRASVVYWPRLSEKFTRLTQDDIRLDTHSSFNAGEVRRIWNKISLSKRRNFQRLRAFNPDLVVISQGHNSGGFEWARACRKAGIPYVIIVNCNSEHWWFREQVGMNHCELHRRPQNLLRLLEQSGSPPSAVGRALEERGSSAQSLQCLDRGPSAMARRT